MYLVDIYRIPIWEANKRQITKGSVSQFRASTHAWYHRHVEWKNMQSRIKYNKLMSFGKLVQYKQRTCFVWNATLGQSTGDWGTAVFSLCTSQCNEAQAQAAEAAPASAQVVFFMQGGTLLSVPKQQKSSRSAVERDNYYYYLPNCLPFLSLTLVR